MARARIVPCVIPAQRWRIVFGILFMISFSRTKDDGMTATHTVLYLRRHCRLNICLRSSEITFKRLPCVLYVRVSVGKLTIEKVCNLFVWTEAREIVNKRQAQPKRWRRTTALCVRFPIRAHIPFAMISLSPFHSSIRMQWRCLLARWTRSIWLQSSRYI